MNLPELIRASHFKSTRGWKVAITIASLFALAFLIAIGFLLTEGVGIWGLNRPVFWGFAITNFVWWVGIGHAGTFISAILFLVRQSCGPKFVDWRKP